MKQFLFSIMILGSLKSYCQVEGSQPNFDIAPIEFYNHSRLDSLRTSFGRIVSEFNNLLMNGVFTDSQKEYMTEWESVKETVQNFLVRFDIHENSIEISNLSCAFNESFYSYIRGEIMKLEISGFHVTSEKVDSNKEIQVLLVIDNSGLISNYFVFVPNL